MITYYYQNYRKRCLQIYTASSQSARGAPTQRARVVEIK